MSKNRLSNRAARRAAQRAAQREAQRSTQATQHPTPPPSAQTPAQTTTPADPVEATAQLLAAEYQAKGSLELYFCRKLASAEHTYNSLQNNLNTLNQENDPEARTRDRLTRMQSRVLRNQALALKELKALQDRRNILERYPDQTKACPPLADHTPFVGPAPKIHAIHPLLQGRYHGPRDRAPQKKTPTKPPTAADIQAELEALLNSTR